LNFWRNRFESYSLPPLDGGLTGFKNPGCPEIIEISSIKIPEENPQAITFISNSH
jgi:hypothetical protein